ncbi:MAG TPA: trypsin-like peptidase domain-containing protein [Thermoanaerobaculia bacterium]|nr:trypsin-like peptidase domain-containing protein [Thermoanaerobaculia bacterium]
MSYENSSPRFLRRLATAALLLGLGFALGVAVENGGARTAGPAAQPRTVAARGDLASDERSTIELFEAASPSVVHITSITRRQDFFSLNVYEIPQGTGTGFFWDDQGHIVTNFHVIQGASRATVTLADQSTWDAEVVGSAPDKDLAVLKVEIPRERMRPLPLGTSRDLKVGQKVFAIGNPFGLDQTLTTGVISALGREIESVTRRPIRDVIQTDAAINPGNSGGPLLDSAGRLVAVNTAIYSPSGAYAGIGFAIPADTVNWVVPQLLQYGELIRPTLGIEAVAERWAQRLGVEEGVLVYRVQEGSGAEKAGLRGTRQISRRDFELGDVILELEGKKVASWDDLLLALERRRAGDRVKLTVERDGRRRTVDVVLGSTR